MLRYECEFIFGYVGVALELGLSESTLKRRVKAKRIFLSKWGSGKTSTVFCSRAVVGRLKAWVGKPS